MKLSLVIPVFNEAPVILPTLRLLAENFEQQYSSDWEIIVVDNASTDDILARVSQIDDARIHVVHLDEKGKGRALRAGFVQASGDIVGFTDVDLSVPPEDIISALACAEAHPGSVVLGSRNHPKSVMPGREWWRTMSSHMFRLLARYIVGVRASDTQCPLKLMPDSVINIFLSTKENTWFFDLEFVAILEGLNIPLVEVPVTWNEHRYPGRQSKLSTTRDGLRAVVAMFRIRHRIPSQLAVLRNIR